MPFSNFLLLYCLLSLVLLQTLSTKNPCQNGCIPSSSNPKACKNNSTYCDAINFQFCPPVNIVRIYTTSDCGDRFSYSESKFNCNGCSCGSDFTVSVDPCKTYQTITGFGGALTDACALNLQCLSPETRSCLLQSYFSCTTGLAYNFIRTPLGSSDFSPYFYTLMDDCTAADAEDPELKCFSLTWLDRLKLEYIRSAISISCQSVYIKGVIYAASEWITIAPLPRTTYIRPEYYDLWALYHYKAAQAYSLCGCNENGEFYLSGGNEPETGLVNPVWEVPLYQKFITHHLCKMLRERNCTVKLLALDDFTSYLPIWMTMLDNSETYACLTGGFATHSYLDDILQPYQEIASETFHKKYPYKSLISSEYTTCEYDPDYFTFGDWHKAEKYIKDIIRKLTHWYQAYIDGNLCLDLRGGPNYRGNYCYSAIRVNCETDEFMKNILFYALGHFSRAVLPGSVRIEATATINTANTNPFGQIPLIGQSSNCKPVELVAFKVPVTNCAGANLVVIILNQNDMQLSGNILISRYGCTTVKMPPKSIITVVLTLPSEHQCRANCQC